MENRYYYNEGLNLCADENWVVDYLVVSGDFESREEARESLHTKHETFGWYDCEVSNTIDEAMMNQVITY